MGVLQHWRNLKSEDFVGKRHCKPVPVGHKNVDSTFLSGEGAGD